MNFKGIIKAITPVQSITTKDNKMLQKVSMLAETEERYPQSITFDVINEDIQKDLPTVGMRVEVELNARATEYHGKYYNNLRAWKINKIQ